MRRLSHPRAWILVGVVLGLGVGLIGALGITQTEWGRGQVLSYTLRTLGGRLNGVLTVQNVEGNLITGARLYGVGLHDFDGEPLARIDSAHIQDRVASFVGGDVVINNLVVWNARIDIFKMPTDTAWNYQEILRDPTPDETPEQGAATLIERLEMHDSRIHVRSPMEPDPELPPGRRQEAFEEILADTARWMIQEVPGGYLRSMVFDVHDGSFREVYIGPDERGGIYLEVLDTNSDVRLWRDPPLQVDSLLGSLHLHEGIVNFRMEEFELPNSVGEMVGRIDIRGDRPLYDVVITSPGAALSDVRWLYPWLPPDPDAGHASGRFWIQDLPDELLFFTEDLVLEMPGTRITGEFGMMTGGERLRFVDVNLEADPLDIDAVEQLLPEDLPVEGLEIGGAVLRGERG